MIVDTCPRRFSNIYDTVPGYRVLYIIFNPLRSAFSQSPSLVNNTFSVTARRRRRKFALPVSCRSSVRSFGGQVDTAGELSGRIKKQLSRYRVCTRVFLSPWPKKPAGCLARWKTLSAARIVRDERAPFEGESINCKAALFAHN